MSNSSRRLSRGDRRRNDRLVALRAVVTRQTAVLGFDLAADKQVCALTDQDSRVLARRTVKAKAWQLREAVEWGIAQAVAAGFSLVVVACEPTGHRWRVLDQIAAQAGVRLVCVQPLLVHRARESEDFTRNKSDESDAVIIARLVTELRCYLPERAEPVWLGCGTSAPAGPAWSLTRPRPASRSPTCSSVPGRPRWRRPASR
jgi:transposase